MHVLYNHATQSIRLVFTLRECKDTPAIPEQIYTKVQDKVTQLKRDQKIANYTLHFKSAQLTWEDIRSGKMDTRTQAQESLSLRMASCFPELDGFQIHRSFLGQVRETKCFISLEAEENSEKIASWHPHWLSRKLRLEIDRELLLDFPKITAAWLAAREGQSIHKLPIGLMADLEEIDSASYAGYRLIVYEDPMRVVLEIHHPIILRKKNTFLKMMSALNALVGRLERVHQTQFRIAKDYLQQVTSETHINSRNFFKTNSIYYLAAVDMGELTGQRHQIGTGVDFRLPLVVDPSHMRVKVQEFSLDWYQRYKIDLTWLQQQLSLQKFRAVRTDLQIPPRIHELLQNRHSLAGEVIFRGIPAKAGKQPFLQLNPQHIQHEDGDHEEESDINPFVRKGELAAQIKYTTPPQHGYNVYGKRRHAVHSPIQGLKVDDSIEPDPHGGMFYAQKDGLPCLQHNRLYIEPATIFSGNVDPTVGNVDVDGPYVIEGHVESGVKIRTTGTLLIKKNLSADYLESGGDLIVEEGISTKDKVVRVQGDILTSYIQNSVVFCQGNITVTGGVIASTLICGGNIHVFGNDSSCIIGGRVLCLGHLTTATLGRNDGVHTTVEIGIGGVQVAQAEQLSHELTKLQHKLTQAKELLQHLREKTTAQKSAQKQQQEAQLPATITQLEHNIQTRKLRIRKLRAQAQKNPQATLRIWGPLSTNCTLRIAGKDIPLIEKLQGVQVSAKVVKNSHFTALHKQDKKKDTLKHKPS
ncbi:MAG: FapA family protein [Zetaproteobacteria bacterium]|nr:FapA family protein [Zetaproteobacteria bacterium]